MRRYLASAFVALALAIAVAPSAMAETSCDPLSTGRVTPPTSLSTIEVVAPPGLLIDEVCLVTAGSAVPTHRMVDPLVSRLALDGEGAAIIEYAASFVIAPESSTEDSSDVFVPPQPATVPLADSEVPKAVNAGGGSTESAPSFDPNALLALAFLAFSAAAVQFAIAHRGKRISKHS